MTAEENIKLLHRILSTTWADGHEDGLFFRPSEDGSVTVHALLNDVFDWACSDVEDITTENVADFEQAWKIVKELDAKKDNCHVCHDAAVLFACGLRKQRPFKYKDAYPVHESLWRLIETLPYPERKP